MPPHDTRITPADRPGRLRRHRAPARPVAGRRRRCRAGRRVRRRHRDHGTLHRRAHPGRAAPGPVHRTGGAVHRIRPGRRGHRHAAQHALRARLARAGRRLPCAGGEADGHHGRRRVRAARPRGSGRQAAADRLQHALHPDLPAAALHRAQRAAGAPGAGHRLPDPAVAEAHLQRPPLEARPGAGRRRTGLRLRRPPAEQPDLDPGVEPQGGLRDGRLHGDAGGRQLRPGRPLRERRAGHHRHLRQLPGVLVRHGVHLRRRPRVHRRLVGELAARLRRRRRDRRAELHR